MVKNSKGDQQKAIQDAKKDGSLNLPMQALSTLQNVPYVINQYVVQAVDWVSQDPERARLVSGFPNIKKTSIEKLDSKEMATKPDTTVSTSIRREKKQKQTIVRSIPTFRWSTIGSKQQRNTKTQSSTSTAPIRLSWACLSCT